MAAIPGTNGWTEPRGSNLRGFLGRYQFLKIAGFANPPAER